MRKFPSNGVDFLLEADANAAQDGWEAEGVSTFVRKVVIVKNGEISRETENSQAALKTLLQLVS